MNNIIHEVMFNVESGYYTVSPSLDIPQGDNNSHVMLIKLRSNDKEFVSISESCKCRVIFEDSSGTVIVSDSVSIINAYRGEMSYVLGNSIVKSSGRFVATIKLTNDYCNDCDICCNSNMSLRLVVNVSKSSYDYSNDYEVTMSRSFYEEIKSHLNNSQIHLDAEDRIFLDTFKNKINELEDLLRGISPVTNLAIQQVDDNKGSISEIPAISHKGVLK